MPAASSSMVAPVIDHLVAVTDPTRNDRPGLLVVLGQVRDPRKRRGVRHSLGCVLALAACAVLAGARSFTAIAEWAADADEQTLTEAGATRGVPSERRSGGRCNDSTVMIWTAASARGRRHGPRQHQIVCVALPWTARPSAVRRAVEGRPGS